MLYQEAPVELLLDDYLLVFQGRVIEVFHRVAGSSQRFHIALLGVEAKPKGDSLHITMGTKDGERILGTFRFKVPLAQQEAVLEFFAASRRVRDGG